MRNVLLVPGINGSGPGHWQTAWESLHPGVLRIAQRDWDRPECGEWAAAIDAAVRAQPAPPIVVAHSLGCLALAHWAASSPLPTHAILMVSVPDPSGPAFPREARGFGSPPAAIAGRRLVAVRSSDDPYAGAAMDAQVVAGWNAEPVSVGARGHVNAASGLGAWPEGWAIVERWRAE